MLAQRPVAESERESQKESEVEGEWMEGESNEGKEQGERKANNGVRQGMPLL